MNELMTVTHTDLVTQDEVHGLAMGDPMITGRLLSLVQPQPVVVNPLLDEYLRAYVLDRLGSPITHLALREHVGRIVLADVEPWRAADPPVPLPLFTTLPAWAMSRYLAGVKALLHDRSTRPLRVALDMLMSVSVDILTGAEAAYLYVKALSLTTGAYQMVERDARRLR